ncbi:MAG: MFS transporter [Defluviitaleaceae bacterium]|nr:MFS transporter [Defluviitaleaceae bacterium]
MRNTEVRRINIHGMVLQFAFWFGICTYFSFTVATLVDHNWTAGNATMAITVMSAVVMFAQPAFGYASDKFISEKKLCVILLIAGSLLFFLFPFALRHSNVLAIATMVAISVTVVQVNGLMDAWIVGLRQENENINYGLMRGTGALAFAVSAQVSGIITVNFDHATRFWVGSAFFIIAAIAAFTFRRAKREPRKQNSVFGSFKKIFSCKKYQLLMVVSFFLFLSNAPMITLIQLLIPEFGGSTAQIGTAIAIMASTEVPFMFMTAFLIRKFSYKWLFVLCGMFYVMRLTLMIFVTDVTGLILVQLLQGVTFAVILSVSMSYLSRIVEEEVRGAAVTTFAAMSMPMTGILANFITSRLLAAGFSAQSTLVIFAASACIGFIIAIYGFVRGLWVEN